MKMFDQVLRYGLVGLIATILHYGIYLLLMEWLNESFAYTIGYVASFICNFFLTCFFTFKKSVNIRRGVGFFISHLINYSLHIILLNLILVFGVPAEYAPIPVFCVVIPVNYLLLRHVFK